MKAISKPTAIHEAGHIVAAKVCLRGFYEIQKPDENGWITDNRGRTFRACASIGGPAFNEDMLYNHISHARTRFCGSAEDTDLYIKLIIDKALPHMVMIFAGPIAEVRYMRKSLTSTWFTSGAQDFDAITSIAKFVTNGDEECFALERRAETIARAIVRKHWGTIFTVADAIRLESENVTSDHAAMAHIQYEENLDQYLSRVREAA